MQMSLSSFSLSIFHGTIRDFPLINRTNFSEFYVDLAKKDRKKNNTVGRGVILHGNSMRWSFRR